MLLIYLLSSLPVHMTHIMISSLLLVLFSISIVVAQEWQVNIDSGPVRGFWSEQHNVWSFRGIPYAAPPTGELRFKSPVPPVPWSDVFNATNDNTICNQLAILDLTNTTITEDCLIINVFAPESARSQGPLPVLFMIHGGGFYFGNGNGYNPYWTTRHDIILITFNYRLGPLGYLCLGTETIPGNAGLKDALEALRWTKRNIAQFGGDPEAITIYGESAGGVQCEALVISKAAEGLFQRAIVESGGALCEFGTNYHRLGLAKALAFRLGAPSIDDLDTVGKIFENTPVGDLQLQSALVGGVHNLCVERSIEGVESVVSDIHRETIMTGNYKKVPIMFTYAELDGMMIAGWDFYGRISEIENNFENFLPPDLVFPNDELKKTVAQQVKEVYFGTEEVTAASIRSYMEFATDVNFVNGMLISALQHAQHAPVYVMEFSYRGGFSQPSFFPELNVASHADIVAHVMDLGNYNNETEQDQVVRDRMTELFTNFVKYGDPTPAASTLGVQWLPFTTQEQDYLNVGSELSMRQVPVQNRSALWGRIYDTYYYPPPVFETSGASSNIPSLVLALCTLVIARLY